MNPIQELEEVRKNKLGISKEDMAHEIGVTMRTYVRWSNGEGKPNFDSIQKIQGFLDQYKVPSNK
ncbi:helix-turn-helix transcriptional regulator [Candidatus Bipolaricaulota bacterium]|nr:helix-turn-helix transcriptional regulator [Candidatus Bipolaricaulota bacterium]